ncbi:MAG: DUF1080 domain-containing protein [bacterium]|jgi:hypothetical protein|nr:DUF1080 domain-containing protein [Planctomycetota bacterium]HIL52293.1 DUF1080 domain-containing protein [Planctomycetota bacterium]
MNKTLTLMSLLSLCLLSAGAASQNAGHNQISPLERASGWQLLFDGETTAGWRSISSPGFPSSGWDVQDGSLHHTQGGGDIVNEEVFGDFELEFEWKVSAGANSGLKYHIPSEDAPAALGPEYQVLDDSPSGDAGPAQGAGALYDLFPSSGTEHALVGEFNRGRIVVRDGRIEHWLNGVRGLSVDTTSPAWRVAHEKSKFSRIAEFGRTGRGRIALQDHGSEVWFRSLRIRRLPAANFEEIDLLAGTELAAWTPLGDASYLRQGRTILGEVVGGSQSFLYSKNCFGDFIFEVDVRTELPGNSGIQIRSHLRENGRVFGYQIEIDPSSRAWSGGLYDEGRRLWLQDLAQNPAGRAAYVHGAWNRYRIECIGPWLRVRVNGVPTVDFFDQADIEGHFGLQVHSGNNTRVRWREPRLFELGRRHWTSVTCSAAEGTVLEETDLEESEGLYTARAEGATAELILPQGGVLGALNLRFSVASQGAISLHASDWHLDLSAQETFLDSDWNAVGLLLDGQRLTVILNGRSVHESRQTGLATESFRLRFACAPATGRLRNLQSLARGAAKD